MVIIIRRDTPRNERADPRCELQLKRETMRNRIVATLIALAISISHIAGAQAFTNGWNFIRAYNCLGIQVNGVDTVFVYPTTGGVLTTVDSTTITAIAPLCTSGDGFYVFLNGSIWNGISVYPSIR